jgi:hypothetical protein
MCVCRASGGGLCFSWTCASQLHITVGAQWVTSRNYVICVTRKIATQSELVGVVLRPLVTVDRTGLIAAEGVGPVGAALPG